MERNTEITNGILREPSNKNIFTVLFFEQFQYREIFVYCKFTCLDQDYAL